LTVKNLEQYANRKKSQLISDNPRNGKQEATTDHQYFDEELYKQRYVIERANAWQDQFKALIIWYETRDDT
jgi:hypothetical protein